MDDRELSLRDIFLETKKQQESLDALDPRTAQHKRTLQSTLSNLQRCQSLITRSSLFSINEELDDILTNDLEYLTVDYLLGELMLKSYDDSRKQTLRHASSAFEQFLNRLDHYDMLSPKDRGLLERYQESRTSFSLISSSNAEERRKTKITRFQEEKALKSKLQALRDQSQSSTTDDEIARQLYLAEIAFFVHQSFQSLDMINQESSILSQIPDSALLESRQSTSDSRQNGRPPDGFSERLDDMQSFNAGRRGGPLLSSAGKPLQPFTLTDKRTQLRQGVFRPDHSLPTMSIDEYLEEERRRGGIIDGGGNANAPQPEADEDNMEQADAATMKAREWDEFVEANPKGAGNTLNRG